MSEELEEKMVEFMRPMFGDMAERTIEKQMDGTWPEKPSRARFTTV
jgi:hypothetical protein